MEVTPALMLCEKPVGLMGAPAERDTGQRRGACVIEQRPALEPSAVAQRHHHLL